MRMRFGHIYHTPLTTERSTKWKKMLLILSEHKDVIMCVTKNVVQVKVTKVANVEVSLGTTSDACLLWHAFWHVHFAS